jgi:L-rhamnose mutarotase
MKRFAQTVLLKEDPEIIRRYEEYHATPWAETAEGLRNCGVLRLFIYRFGRQLLMFMETVDSFELERDMQKYNSHPKAREWDELMKIFQEASPGAPPDSTWVLMHEVFALEP